MFVISVKIQGKLFDIQELCDESRQKFDILSINPYFQQYL